MNEPPSTARMLLRHAATLGLVGVYSAVVAPSIATVLLALRSNGLGFELLYSAVLAPLAVAYAGPAAFMLGAVGGWMMLALVRLDLNLLPSRIAVAVVVASTAWALAEPLPHDGVDTSSLGDWTIWCASAALTSLIFTRRWWDRRAGPPFVRSGD